MPTCRIPGPICVSTSPPIDKGTLVLAASPNPAVAGLNSAPQKVASPISADTRLLAATAYGEGSAEDVYEEMAAIANVLVRQQKARKYTSISAFIKAEKTFAFAAHDGNQRFKKLNSANAAEIEKDPGMLAALRGAKNALTTAPVDYSNGAFFWDGSDIKTNYENHAKVLGGIHISDPSHNIYDIKDKDVPGENWWFDGKGNKTKTRGAWKYKYITTAGWGGTFFWKYSVAFLKATGNKEYK
jgi:hypothetical protein